MSEQDFGASINDSQASGSGAVTWPADFEIFFAFTTCSSVVMLARQKVSKSHRKEKYHARRKNQRHHSKMCSAGSGKIFASPRPRRIALDRNSVEMTQRTVWSVFAELLGFSSP